MLIPQVMDRFERAGNAFANLCRIMARLRGEDGCPWDRAQSLSSLKPYLLEETYEVLEAIDAGAPDSHRSELGDLLLQIVFQAEIANETNSFSAADVAEAISDKLYRRHPHVFGDASGGGTPAAWEALKAKERPPGTSCLDGVPKTLPSLLRAYRTGEKAAAVGFDWPDAGGPMEKIEEEYRELADSLSRYSLSPHRLGGNDQSPARGMNQNPGTAAQATSDHTTSPPPAPAPAPATPQANSNDSPQQAEIAWELGDLLFSVVNLARHLKLDPEDCLRLAIGRFTKRFQYVEARLAEEGRIPAQVSLDRLNELWEQAKVQGNNGSPGVAE